jgi:molecular chaperone DnaK (HSP70)
VLKFSRRKAGLTIIDQQSQVDIRIYQGESRDALENIKIGEFRVDGLSKAAAIR